jgi:hypothetical protein
LAVQKRERALPHVLLAVAIALLVAVPWSLTVALRTTGSGVDESWLIPTVESVFWALLDISGVAGIGLALAVVGLWTLRRSGRGAIGLWLATWGFAPLVLAVVATPVRPIFLDRYLIVCAPAFALLAGVAVVAAGRRYGPALAAVVVGASVVVLVGWYSTSREGNWRGEDWRSAVAALRTESGGTDVVVVPWWANPAASYYGAAPTIASTDDAVWLLRWSETGRALPRLDYAPPRFGAYELVERHAFGRRLSLEQWVRIAP